MRLVVSHSDHENRTPSYKERLTETLISGGFVGNRNGKRDWLYYLGETEIQRCQWNAVMRWLDKEKGREQRPGDDSKLPRTEVTVAEVYEFLEALNTWMLSHERNSLPNFRGATAFCRLPTEAEWDFAARGGIKILESSPGLFNRQHPYGDDIGRYEWNRSSSGNQVRECGTARPNPLGLYDMLGNVEELTINLFSPEYLQGRFGDYVVRGGNYSESELSASHRSEYFAYQAGGAPNRSPKLGFRLALSTRISSVQSTPQELDSAYDSYTKNNGLTRPGPLGESSPAEQAAQDRLHYLETELAQVKSEHERRTQEITGLKQKIWEQTALKSDVDDINRILNEKNKDLVDKLARAEEQIRKPIDGPRNPPVLDDKPIALQAELNEARRETLQLREKLVELQEKLRKEQDKVLAKDDQDKKKEQEISDLNRRATLFTHEVDKNTRRVREVEKRYLEALMRQASANAYLGLRILKKLELFLQGGRVSPTDREYQERLKEGSQMVYDYCSLVAQIAEKTQKDLLPEVKSELSDWLKTRENEDSLGWQRKSLDLIERHVRDMRAGRYPRPGDLVKSFPNEPEFKK